MTAFKRHLEKEIIKNLKEENLFQGKLLQDIHNGTVFPAIRDGYIDFYYRGGRLFTFKGQSFKTHIKYASVLKSHKNTPYVSQSDLETNVLPIKDFGEEYDRIKENCSNYSGVEAQGVSALYSKFSYAASVSNKPINIVVLDIEIAFSSDKDSLSHDEKRKTNRIDLLLFDIGSRRLRFVEAKHFSNTELWSKTGTKPKIVGQVQRYERLIDHLQDDIKKAYAEYISTSNELFELELQEVNSDDLTIDEKVTLIIFGFDSDQLAGRFKALLKDDESLKGIQYYAIGDVKEIKIKNFWNKLK